VVKAGRDPGIERKVSAADTFNALADQFIAGMAGRERADTTIVRDRRLLSYARPALGSRPIAEIHAGDVLAVLNAVQKGGQRESAHRLRSLIGQVFRLAIAEAKATRDPTSDLRGQLQPVVVTHRAALTDAKAFGGLLRAIDGYDQPATRAALLLCALIAPCPGELRLAEWAEFDLEARVWTVPAARMKQRRPHSSPLSEQAILVLRELRELPGGGRGLLFPGLRSQARPISENTLNAALRRLGFSKDQATSHGFRSSFSSLANESGLWHPDAIERQLSHVDENAVRRAYARGEHWDERVKLMQWWADEVDRLRDGGEVIQLAAHRK
jgi:integrase